MKKTVLTLMAACLFLSCSEENESKEQPKELPVKVTLWTASGAMSNSKTLLYDSQNRLSQIVATDANTDLNYKVYYTYESGKVTMTTDYDNPVKADEKQIIYHNKGWIDKEAFFKDGVLQSKYTWKNNLDGTKTAVRRNSNGEITTIYTYHFNKKGNITFIDEDQTNPTETDRTIAFDGYDTGKRAVFNYNWMRPWSEVPGVFVNPLLPNNPTGHKILVEGYNPVQVHTNNYEYNLNGNVVFQKIFNGSGQLINTMTYEYAAVDQP